MDSYIRIAIAILIFSFFSADAAAQGGDNCAQAVLTPVSIPFSTNGTTCGAANDYFGIGSACGINNNTWGNDWIYYFVAPSSGNITVALLNTLPNPSFSSLSVWDDCPTSGSCVTGLAAPNVGNDQYIIVPVNAGQGYYVLIDNLPPPNCFNYSIRIDYESFPVSNPQCINLDFENNNLMGWHGTVGNTTCSQLPSTTADYTPVASGFPTSQHTITSGNGTDPCGGFPVVFPGGLYSLRLGDGTISQAAGASIEQTFVVSASEPMLIYNYALVLEDGGHAPTEQPFFKCELFDAFGQPLSCGQYEVTASPNMAGFLPGTCLQFTAWYKPWTTIAADLSAYINQTITLRFTVGDCCNKGHFSYAYIDADCQPLQLTSSNDTLCSGSSVTISAPPGFFSYQWSTGDTSNSITTTPVANTIYTCTVVSIVSSACIFTFRDTIYVNPSPVAFPYTVHSDCNRNFVFSDSSIVSSPDSIVTWLWDFGDNTTSNSDSVSHNYATSGMYLTSLTVTSNNGCADTSSLICIARDSAIAGILSDPVCQGQITHFFGDTANADYLLWNFGDPFSIADTSDIISPDYLYGYAGSFMVSLIAGGPYSCPDTAYMNAIVNPAPIAAFSSSSDSISALNSTIQFLDLSQGAFNWYWNFGDNFSVAGVQSPVHEYFVNTLDTVSYNVQLIVSNNFNCTDTVYHVIHIYPEFTFWVPSSFTPNGDGVNEQFFVYGIGWSEVYFMLFDRWGNLMYESTSAQPSWNGNDGQTNKPCQEDVYVWRAFITDFSGQTHVRMGSVTLVR